MRPVDTACSLEADKCPYVMDFNIPEQLGQIFDKRHPHFVCGIDARAQGDELCTAEDFMKCPFLDEIGKQIKKARRAYQALKRSEQ